MGPVGAMRADEGCGGYEGYETYGARVAYEWW